MDNDYFNNLGRIFVFAGGGEAPSACFFRIVEA